MSKDEQGARILDWPRACLAAIALALAYYLIFLSRPLWLEKDSAVYFLLGQSLAQGKGYTNVFSPSLSPHILYPPGYPFILSGLMRIFGDSLLILRLATVAMAGGSLLLLPRILHDRARAPQIFLILLLFAFNPVTLKFAQHITAEVPYTLFSWLAVYYFGKKNGAPDLKDLALGTACAVGAFYMRSVGIALCLSLPAYLALRKKFRPAFWVALGTILAILPWFLRGISATHDNYLDFITRKDVYDLASGSVAWLEVPLRAGKNIIYYAGKVIPDLVFFPFLREATLGNPLFLLKLSSGAMLSFLILRGFFKRAKKGAGLTEIYLAFYFAALFLYVFHSERFLLPVYPFLLSYLLADFGSRAWQAIKKCVIFVLLASLCAAQPLVIKNIAFVSGADNDPYAQSLSWIRKMTPASSLVISLDPAGVYLHTQRKGVMWEFRSALPRDSLRQLQEKKADYLIVSHSLGPEIKGRRAADIIGPLLNEFPGVLAPVYKSAGQYLITVYQVKEKP